jgi:L-arabinokinase
MNDLPAPPRSDLSAHLALLRGLPARPDSALTTLFQRNVPVFVARSPGRLDVMGGIADYSGSLVLQLPIAEAAIASVQITNGAGATVTSLAGNGNVRTATIGERQWAECLRAADYRQVRQLLGRDASAAWSAYVLGPVLVLLRERPVGWRGGLRVLIDSRVPEGKGVSSSAAVEVATMRAFAAALRVELTGEELARLCQLAENRVVGAPCGIMDQMTAAVGRHNELVALRCQPAVVEGYVPVPKEIAFWGVDSGIRHAVSGSDYTSVRCGAFMGYRIIADLAELPARAAASEGDVWQIDDPQWNGYLANIPPETFHARFAASLPAQMKGDQFLRRFGGTTDRATRVDPGRTYAVRQPTLHPIEENRRVGRFRELLQSEITDAALEEMGQLMLESHVSYSACGLGSDGTDLIVELARQAGPASGLYGAKITGGGSGGSVAILGRAGADPAVERIAEQYSRLAGRPSYVFRGSSPGACSTDVLRVVV